MNRAYRGAGVAGWSTQEAYLSGDRITEDVLRSDLLAKPQASLLKWEDPEGGSLLGCVWIEPLGEDVWYLGSGDRPHVAKQRAWQGHALGR